MMQTRANTKRSAAGFSLMECMVAITVLSVAAAALLMPFTAAANAARIDSKRTTAATLATQMLERLTDMSYGEILAMDGTVEAGESISSITGQPLNAASLAGFTRRVDAAEVTVTASGANGDATFVRVVVTVTCDGVEPIEMRRLFGSIDFNGG